MVVACYLCYYAGVIRSFRDQGTADLFNEQHTALARRACPLALWPVAQRKLSQLDWAKTLEDMAKLPGNRLQRLVGDRAGQYSIRINRQYRICFEWTQKGPVAVEITDYH